MGHEKRSRKKSDAQATTKEEDTKPAATEAGYAVIPNFGTTRIHDVGDADKIAQSKLLDQAKETPQEAWERNIDRLHLNAHKARHFEKAETTEKSIQSKMLLAELSDPQKMKDLKEKPEDLRKFLDKVSTCIKDCKKLHIPAPALTNALAQFIEQNKKEVIATVEKRKLYRAEGEKKSVEDLPRKMKPGGR